MKIEIKEIIKSTFSSLTCPSCDKNLQPHYHKGAVTPSYYYCQEATAPYANTPHYKYFNEDGYGYEVYLIWLNASRGHMYSVKRSFDNDKYFKVEITYYVEEPGALGSNRKPVTRIFSPDEFEINPKDLEGLKEKVKRFAEIAEIFQ
jgi:hypothetical protein